MFNDLSWVAPLRAKWGEKILGYRESAPAEPEFKIGAEDLLTFLRELKELSGGEFNHLADLTSYDESPKSPRFYVVYELISMNRKQRARVLVPCASDEKPSVPSVGEFWAGAGWLEREVYDLMGIDFKNHLDQRRILLPPSFKGHPLRKDFSWDYRQEFPETSEQNQVFDPFGSNIVNVPASES